LQAVGFTSVCSTWCRGRGQSGAVISWYAAVRNEARATWMMLISFPLVVPFLKQNFTTDQEHATAHAIQIGILFGLVLFKE